MDQTNPAATLASFDPVRDAARMDALIEAILEQFRRNPGADQEAANIIASCGVQHSHNQPQADALFHKLVVPAIALFAEQGRFELLLTIESHLYNSYIKFRENEEHFARSYRALMDGMRAGGIKFGALIKKTEFKRPIGVPKPYKVAFLVHSASMLAHIETLLAMLRGYRQQPFQPFLPYVVVLGGYDPRLDQALQAVGAKPVFLKQVAQQAKSHAARLDALRQVLVQLDIPVLVFVSVVVSMPFVFAARLAPVQIWWAMKYHTLESPEIDGYLCGGTISRFKMLGGRQWRAAPHGANDWFDAALTPKAREIKAGLGAWRLVLGSYGREEKLRDPAFLEVVCRILKAYPDCCFLWTGRTQDPVIEGAFKAHGVTGQTRFIGWVDTKVYAQVLDVFLDSFPFPAGFTIYQAMAAGVAAVLYEVPEADIGIQNSISKLYFGEEGEAADQQNVAQIFAKDSDAPLYLLAKDVEQYYALACKVIENAAFRHAVGQAGKRFIEEYMSNPARMGEGYARHIDEVARETYFEAKA